MVHLERAINSPRSRCCHEAVTDGEIEAREEACSPKAVCCLVHSRPGVTGPGPMFHLLSSEARILSFLRGKGRRKRQRKGLRVKGCANLLPATQTHEKGA